MKTVAEVIGVSRSNLIERMRERAKKRIGRPPLPDDKLVAEIKAVITELPTYGYRRASQHPSVYIIEENRLCRSGCDPAGCRQVGVGLDCQTHPGAGRPIKHRWNLQPTVRVGCSQVAAKDNTARPLNCLMNADPHAGPWMPRIQQLPKLGLVGVLNGHALVGAAPVPTSFGQDCARSAFAAARPFGSTESPACHAKSAFAPESGHRSGHSRRQLRRRVDLHDAADHDAVGDEALCLIRRMPVLDKERLAGLVSIGDALKWQKVANRDDTRTNPSIRSVYC
jgi:putative transposase